jgi:hypothetical protein
MKQTLLIERAITGLMVAVLGGSCSVRFQPGPAYQDMEPSDLPKDPLSLLSIAHAAYSPYGPIQAVQLSLNAAEKVLARHRHSENELASFYYGRAVIWLLEFDENLSTDEAKDMAGRSFERLRAAVERNSDRVDYAFLAGASLGNYIRFSSVQAIAQIRQVNDYFRRAVDLDPSYDDGAPLRALGTLLVQAPPWPAGVGDSEEGLELLEEAAQLFPGHPANHLYLADALVGEGRKSEGAAAYRRVMDLCAEPRWGAVCDRYNPRAQASLQRLQ